MAVRTEVLNLQAGKLCFNPDIETGMVMYGSGSQESREFPIWVQNVVPTDNGYRSIERQVYINTPAPVLPSAFKSRNLTLVRSVTGQEGWYYTAGSAPRVHYVWYGGVWNAVFSISDGTVTRPVSHAMVNGLSYTFTAVDGLFGFSNNFAAKVEYTPDGILPNLMRGIAHGMDYLIFYDFDTIYWSAPGISMEFRPIVSDIPTGAGSSKIQDLRGQIVAVHAIAGGFMIYSTENVVAARYSGNSLNPWIFSEVRGSGGIYEAQQCVAVGSSAASHFTWGKSGLQEVNLTQATSILPQVSDYLASRKYVEFTGSAFVESTISIESKIVNFCFVANRYVCIAVSITGYANPTVYNHIIVYDVLIKKWSRIKVDCIGIFDFSSQGEPLLDKVSVLAVWTLDGRVSLFYLSQNANMSAFNSMPVLESTYMDLVGGSHTLPSLYMDLDSVTTDLEEFYSDLEGDLELLFVDTRTFDSAVGCIVLGKFSLTASSVCSLNVVRISGKLGGTTAPLVAVRTRDPEFEAVKLIKTDSPVVGNNNYYLNSTGRDHSVLINGTFDIDRIAVDMVQRGRL